VIASERSHRHVGTEHLLAAVLDSEDRDVLELLQRVGVDRLRPQQLIDRLLAVWPRTWGVETRRAGAPP
jgi:ATP-dependent Clp protease ATP-binding subunit ClpA